ncbi:MAG: hypothetical protein AAF975_04170 [Spirochaetota bacterium]
MRAFLLFIPLFTTLLSRRQLSLLAVIGLLSPHLWAYSFQYENLFLVNIKAGFSNFATRDVGEIPSRFTFAQNIGFTRYSFMPIGSFDATLVLRDNYLLRLELLLDNLRNQQSNFSLGLGNENIGLLFGPAQEYTLASLNRPGRLGVGLYSKLFYNLQGIMDLQYEGVFLTNTLNNSDVNGYRNFYLYLQALFMISQVRIGVKGTLHFFESTSTGPTLIQTQGKLLIGGSAPARFFSLDFYFSCAGIVNQGLAGNKYSVLFIGLGFELKFATYRRVIAGFFGEIMPFGISTNNVGTIDKDTAGFTFGLSLSFRVSRKELWTPELLGEQP